MQPFYPRRIPYASRPLIGIDTETSGVIAGYHELIEIALAPKDEAQQPWIRRLKMRYPDRAQPDALRIAKYNRHDWADAVDLDDVWLEFEEKINGVTLVGHNVAGFDVPMIRGNSKFILREERFDQLRFDVIDTMMLARVFLVDEGLKGLSLKACREFFGKTYEGAHSAYDDAVMSLELYEDITQRVRYHGKPRQESLF